MRLTLGQVRSGLCTRLFLPELVVTSTWCVHTLPFRSSLQGLSLVFKEALIQFAVAVLRSVWTRSTLMGKTANVCSRRCASESRYCVKLEDEYDITGL